MLSIVLAYASGALLGAATTGLVLSIPALAASTAIDNSVRKAAFLLLCLFAVLERLAAGLRWIHPWLPERRRLIGRDRLVSRGLRGVREFGYLMGLGWWVYMPSPAPYCLAIAFVVAAPPAPFLMATVLGFALGRITPLVAAALTADARGRARLLARLEHLSGPFIATVAGLSVMMLTLPAM